MKNYKTPELKIILIMANDIITTSGVSDKSSSDELPDDEFSN